MTFFTATRGTLPVICAQKRISACCPFAQALCAVVGDGRSRTKRSSLNTGSQKSRGNVDVDGTEVVGREDFPKLRSETSGLRRRDPAVRDEKLRRKPSTQSVVSSPVEKIRPTGLVEEDEVDESLEETFDAAGWSEGIDSSALEKVKGIMGYRKGRQQVGEDRSTSSSLASTSSASDGDPRAQRGSVRAGGRSAASSRQYTSGKVERGVSTVVAHAAVRLLRIEQGGAYSNLLKGAAEDREDGVEMPSETLYLQRTLGFTTLPLEPSGKRLVTELVAGVTRWKRYLDFLVREFYDGNPRNIERMEPLLCQILRLGVFQMVKMGRAPHGTVNELVELAKLAIRPGAGNMVNFILRKIGMSLGSLPAPALEGVEDSRARARVLSTIHSHPVWLVRRWVSQFGESGAVKLMEYNNTRPVFCLRANVAKAMDRSALSTELETLGVKFVVSPHLDDFVRVQEGLQNVLKAGLLSQGKCAVQDESAGLVVRLLDPQPGEYIVDCCAAPGGKAIYAASLMEGQGSVVAVDVHEGRSRAVRSAAGAQGLAATVSVRVGDVREFGRQSGVTADRVLLDAPCSGLGTVGRNADLRWNRQPEDLAALSHMQDELLDSACLLVRVGGILVYSTCSIDPEENQHRVEAFLSRNPAFRLENAAEYIPKELVTEEGYLATVPHVHGMDGAFGARMRHHG